MEIFHPACNRRALENWISTCEGEVYIFTPFFTDAGLEVIRNFKSESAEINLLVRASFNDFLSGALSLSALKTALSLKWRIKRYENLHAKAFFNMTTLYFGSVNITRRGLGYPPGGNFELLAKMENVDKKLMEELLDVWNQSIGVNEKYMHEIDENIDFYICEYAEKREVLDQINKKHSIHKKYSLRHIVQSNSILSFHKQLCNGGSNSQVFNHDYNLLCAHRGISCEKLFDNFLNIKLIEELLIYVGNGRYFGDLRKWLIKNVEDVPTPSREDFNSQLNKLYDLVVEASQGKYRRVIPGRKSEKLEKIVGK